ncbi:MAG: ABC transporter ATP-binding protein, partial [Actinomyces sp.]
MSSTPSPTLTRPAASPVGAAPAAPAVRVRGLRKTFGPVVAVDSLDLTVAPGEVVAFLGPNGAGKSTTLDVVLGFTRPDAGTAAVLGVAPREAVRAGRVGAVLQAGGLIPSFTVRQTLDIIASLQLRAPDVEAIIDQTDLRGILRRR